MSRLKRMDGQQAHDAHQSLTPLVCGVFSPDGKLVSLAAITDPRASFMREYNALANDIQTGLSARPLDAEEAAIARKLLAERTVTHA